MCIPTVISPQKSGTHRGWQDVWFLFSVRTVVTCRLSNCTTYLALALEKTIQRIVRLGLPIPMLCLPSCSRRASCCGLNACLSRTRVQTTLSGRRLWTLSSLVWREGAEEKTRCTHPYPDGRHVWTSLMYWLCWFNDDLWLISGFIKK